MMPIRDILIVAGMFVLRIGIPLVIIAGLAYLLKRLDRRWEEEARRERSVISSVPQPAPAKPGRKPGTDVPGLQLPFDPGLRSPQPAFASAPDRYCWDVKGCSKTQRTRCPAFAHPDLPCWQARFQDEGHMPEHCSACQMFHRYPSM
jgi:hypothetical protein